MCNLQKSTKATLVGEAKALTIELPLTSSIGRTELTPFLRRNLINLRRNILTLMTSLFSWGLLIFMMGLCMLVALHLDRMYNKLVTLGQIFPFVFVFLHLLVIVYSFSFRSQYFVNYAPLLRTVCKSIYLVCYLALFLPRVLCAFQCNSVRGISFFPGFPNHRPSFYPQHLLSSLDFIFFFNFVLHWLLGSLSVLQLLFFRSV